MATDRPRSFTTRDDDPEGSGPSHCSCRQRLLSTACPRPRLAAIPVPGDPAHVTTRALLKSSDRARHAGQVAGLRRYDQFVTIVFSELNVFS
jgi:hypothetical protein